MLLDVQGTDSREAGDAGRRFDRQAALFALALSDVLCVNLWENDIGRAQASNLDLLRLVLEVNLELRAAPTNATAAPPVWRSGKQKPPLSTIITLLAVASRLVASPNSASFTVSS